MTRYFAFLRGMNLGGRRITNTDLCAAFERLGYAGVQAFLASGNVTFEAEATPAATRRALEQGLARELGYAVPTFLRSAAELCTVLAAQPFAGRKGSETRGKHQVVFLQHKPSREARAAALTHDSPEDWLALEGQELHWSPRGGLSDSELDFGALEKALGATTVRTRNTVERLAAKFLAS